MKAAFVATLSFLAAVSAFAGVSGKITSADQIQVSDKSESKTIEFGTPLSTFELGEEKTSVYLRTQAGENTLMAKCGSFLGQLDAPISMNVQVDGQNGVLTIPARGTFVFANGGCDGNGRPLILQIDVKKSDKDHLIVLDIGNEEGKKRIEQRYKGEIIADALAMVTVRKRISEQDYKAARIAYAEVAHRTLLPSELKELLALRLTMPEKERPIDTSDDFISQDLSKIVGVDVDTMTMAEYLTFFNAYFSKFRSEKVEGDQTYAFRLMTSMKVPKADHMRILETAIKTYAEGIIAFAKAGGTDRTLPFSSQYVLLQTVLELSIYFPEESKDFMTSMRKEVMTEMAHDKRVADIYNDFVWFSRVTLTHE